MVLYSFYMLMHNKYKILIIILLLFKKALWFKKVHKNKQHLQFQLSLLQEIWLKIALSIPPNAWKTKDLIRQAIKLIKGFFKFVLY